MEPRFLKAAEELGRERGMTGEELLREARERASNSGYPTSECILPSEELTPERLNALEEHLKTCVPCQMMVETMQRTSGD